MYFLKSISEDGNLCKTYLSVDLNGSVEINQLFLINSSDVPKGMHILYSKFGKSLCVVAVAFKYSSLSRIYIAVTNTIIANNLKII